MKKDIKFQTKPKLVFCFSEEEKHEIIKDCLTSGFSKQDVWKKYTGRAKEHGAILRWMRELGYETQKLPENRIFATKQSSMKKDSLKTIDSFETYRLEKRISELEKQLQDAEMKAIAFSTMVDIAEKEFKIPIRKKSNTKPLKK